MNYNSPAHARRAARSIRLLGQQGKYRVIRFNEDWLRERDEQYRQWDAAAASE